MNDIRNLREKNKRRKYRHKGTGFLFAVFSFIVIVAAVLTAMIVFFKISNIEISGKTPLYKGRDFKRFGNNDRNKHVPD